MFVWLSMRAFEFMFNTHIVGGALWFLQALGFLELLIELVSIVLVIGFAIFGKNSKNDIRKEIEGIKNDAISTYKHDHDNGDVAIYKTVKDMTKIIERYW